MTDAERALPVHVCSFSDPTDYTIAVDGKSYLFDFSERFGPALIGKRGQLLSPQSGPKRFYVAVSWWARQGKRVHDGLCVWEIPRYAVVMLDKRNAGTVEIAKKLGLSDEYIAANTGWIEESL